MPTATRAFAVYLRTPATALPEVLSLCGQPPSKPCQVAYSPFVRVVAHLFSGTRVVYRIQRIATDGNVEVLVQGSQVIGSGGLDVSAIYPPPTV
jgi:hypothetical protein